MSFCRPVNPPPQPCYFIGTGTLSQTLTLRAAFASSTYLLSQIPGPGRSSDDDLLTSPFKGAHQGLRAFHRRPAALPANSGPASDDLSQSPYPPFQGGTSGPAGFPSPLGFPCSPTPARHLMMPCQSFGLCFFACPVLKKFTDVEWCVQRVINYVSVF